MEKSCEECRKEFYEKYGEYPVACEFDDGWPDFCAPLTKDEYEERGGLWGSGIGFMG